MADDLSSPAELEAPLLLGDGDEDLSLQSAHMQVVDLPVDHPQRSSLSDSCWNLCNVILGAGLFALPRVFAALGLLGGTAAVAAVAYLTFASIDLMLTASERLRKSTYASTMHEIWGRQAAVAVHAAVIAGCCGFIALYIIITCDVVVGNDKYSGIISDLFPALPDPLPWYLSRTALITWITLTAAPLLSASTLHGMAAVSQVSVATSMLSSVALVGLCLASACHGKLAHVHWLPDMSFFGDQRAVIATHMLATIPVLMTAFVCHMSIHPIAADLDKYTPRRMRTVVGSSLLLTSLTYAAVGAAGYAVFGVTVEGDILSNVQAEKVAELLGISVPTGLALTAGFKIAVVVSMLTSIPINLWPVRADVLDLLHHALREPPSTVMFYFVTYATLLCIYLGAICIKSAYSMVSLVGATCGIAMAFFFPGLIALRLPGREREPESGGSVVEECEAAAQEKRRHSWLGGVLVGFGVVLMAAGVTSTWLGVDDEE